MLAVGHRACLGEHGFDPIHSNYGPRQFSKQPPEDSHRQSHQSEQIGKGHQSASGQHALVDSPSPDEQHSEYADIGKGFDDRIERGAKTPDFDHTIAQLVRPLTEPSDLVVFASKGLDHECRIERFVGDVRHLGTQSLSGCCDRPHPSLEHVVDDDHERTDGKSDESQVRVRDDKEQTRTQQHQHDSERHR